jgi:hypothetical protein
MKLIFYIFLNDFDMLILYIYIYIILKKLIKFFFSLAQSYYTQNSRVGGELGEVARRLGPCISHVWFLKDNISWFCVFFRFFLKLMFFILNFLG